MRLSQQTGAFAVGQGHVYIPPLAGTFTGSPRLVLCPHGAGASAQAETYGGKQNYMLRLQAIAKAGLAQLWIDGGAPGVVTTGALAAGATALALSAPVTSGVYILDPNNGATTENTVTVTAAGGSSATPACSALAKNHVSGVALLSASATGWGSDADLTMLDAAWAWAKTNLPVKTDKVVTYANSAGNIWALAWALTRPNTVLAHAGSLPAVDPQDIRDNNRQNLAAQVETAASGNGIAGTAPADSWYAARSPVRNQAQLAAVPQKFWYSDGDTIALPTISAAYCTAVGATQTDMGSAGHTISTPAPYGCLPYNDVATWLKTYA